MYHIFACSFNFSHIIVEKTVVGVTESEIWIRVYKPRGIYLLLFYYSNESIYILPVSIIEIGSLGEQPYYFFSYEWRQFCNNLEVRDSGDALDRYYARLHLFTTAWAWFSYWGSSFNTRQTGDGDFGIEPDDSSCDAV